MSRDGIDVYVLDIGLAGAKGPGWFVNDPDVDKNLEPRCNQKSKTPPATF
jgi:hypothetical protein